ncbi:MAG: SAM-dependent methyltransferase [Phycisphaerales bacterium]
MPRRVLHDPFFKQAKAEGYLARSAYKLKEIQERFKLMPRGGRVLDLGCAPGSWLQVAAETVGPKGTVVGIDLTEVRHDFGPNVRAVKGDVNAIDPGALTAAAGGLFDAVLSDMAPNTSGAGDDFLSARLCRRVLELTPSLLRHGGASVMKILEGTDYPDVLRETRAMFAAARGFKPKASREVSREMYVVATGFKAPADAQLRNR